jgi:F-type H+-transporting ATPase subunit c
MFGLEVTKMDPNALHSLGIGITMLGVTGPALAIGMIGKAAIDAAARNPNAINEIRMLMIMAIAFAEAVAIYVLVIAIK